MDSKKEKQKTKTKHDKRKQKKTKHDKIKQEINRINDTT
jgi:hypothetical protein